MNRHNEMQKRAYDMMERASEGYGTMIHLLDKILPGWRRSYLFPQTKAEIDALLGELAALGWSAEKYIETVWVCDYCKHKANTDNLYCDEAQYSDQAPIGIEAGVNNIDSLVNLMQNACPSFVWLTNNVDEVRQELKSLWTEDRARCRSHK